MSVETTEPAVSESRAEIDGETLREQLRHAPLRFVEDIHVIVEPHPFASDPCGVEQGGNDAPFLLL